MREIKHIVLTDGAPVRVVAGEHLAEPLLLEAGSERRASIVLEAGAKLHLTAFVLATDGKAGLSLMVDLAGEEAEFHLHALYIASAAGSKEGRADINVRVDHSAVGCVSRQLVKGIVADTATGSFSGMVHVAKNAQRTDASQRNKNLQLSDTANIFTTPQLEIYAEDVRCSHGATIGRLNEEEIYYMRQRGISAAEARRMQMRGFAGEIINHSPSEDFRKSIEEKISGILDRF